VFPWVVVVIVVIEDVVIYFWNVMGKEVLEKFIALPPSPQINPEGGS
jgi:hypothetical protein